MEGIHAITSVFLNACFNQSPVYTLCIYTANVKLLEFETLALDTIIIIVETSVYFWERV